MPHLKRWLARLAFSFLILAGLTGWTVYQAQQTGGWTVRSFLLACLAIVMGALGMTGLKLRHHLIAPPMDDPSNDR
jgi:biotin transporter BioY